MGRPIRYIRESSHYGRAFVNDADVNSQVEHWLEEVANVRQHGTTGERPVDRFERVERSVLRPFCAGAATPSDAARRSLSNVDEQRRSLRVYAESVR